MSYKARAAHNFSKLSDEQIVTMATTVKDSLTNNPAFPAPTVDLKTLQDAADGLAAALAAQAQGGTRATAEKNEKREVLMEHLRKLKHYVEDNCGNNLPVLLSSGFQAASTSRALVPLERPSILNIILGNTGEMMLKISRLAHAKCYQVRSAVVGAGGVYEPWQSAGLYTSSRSVKVTDLTPGTVYAFQVRAIGGSTGYSDWSLPVTRICA